MTILGVAYSYFGYYYTYYGLGVYLTPLVFVLSGLIAGIAVWVLRALRKNWQMPWRRRFWMVFSSVGSALFAALLIYLAVDNYKPSYYMYVPEDFEGMVHLLPSKEASEELYIDENGIGYYRSDREVNVIVMRGEEDITNALNQYGRKSLIFKQADSLHYKAIEITCFEVVEGRHYGSSPWNQPHAQCMDEAEFVRRLETQEIDSTRVVQKKYKVVNSEQ